MTKKTKRIMISSNLYRPNIGGAENSMYNLAIEYSQLGYEVDIVSSDMNNISDEALALEEVITRNVTVYRYKADHKLIPRTFYMYYTAISLFRRLLSSNEYEFLFVRSHFNVITAWLAGMRDIRFLLAGVVKNQRANERASLCLSKKQLIKRYLDNTYHHLLQKVAVKMASEILVFSQNMVAQLVDVFSYSSPVPIVKPGVDLKRFSILSDDERCRLKASLSIPEGKIILLGLGRFVQSKGYEQVIAALPFLSKDIVFCLVGQGVEQQTYSDLAIQHGVQNQIMFFPPTDKPERYYQVADIFMMTSIYETLGQTILEAQACGLPVVAFEPSEKIITATKEITNSDTAVFCQEGITKELVAAILTVRGHLSNNIMVPNDIRAFIERNFSWRSLSLKIKGNN